MLKKYSQLYNQLIIKTNWHERRNGNIISAANIVAKFEANVKNAQKALETATDESMFVEWKMVMGGTDPIFPVMARIQVVRFF